MTYVIPKGGLYVDIKDDRHPYPKGEVSETTFNAVRHNFLRAEKDTPVTAIRKPVKFYTSIRETEHTNLVVFEKCLLEGESLLCPQGFLYDDSTSIESKDYDSFYDLVFLSAYETLNAVVDKDKVSVSDIRKDYVSHSTPIPIGACYLDDSYVVVTTLAMHLPFFPKLAVCLNEKYSIMPLPALKESLKGIGPVYRVFNSMNEIKGGKDHESK